MSKGFEIFCQDFHCLSCFAFFHAFSLFLSAPMNVTFLLSHDLFPPRKAIVPVTSPRAPPSSLIRIIVPARLPCSPPIATATASAHVCLVLGILPVVLASLISAVDIARLVVLLTMVVWDSLRSIGVSVPTAAAEAVALIILVCFVELVRPVAADPRIVVQVPWHRGGAAEEDVRWALCCCGGMPCRGLFVAVEAERAFPSRCLLGTSLDRSGKIGLWPG